MLLVINLVLEETVVALQAHIKTCI